MQSKLDSKCKVYYTKNAKRTLQILSQNEKGAVLRTRLPELRKKNKLSQAELADKVGVTRQTITSIETGKYTASLPLAYKLAQYFDLKIEDVFMLEEEDL